MQHNQYSANGPRVPGAHEHEGRVLMTVCTRTRRFHQRLGLAGIAPSHSHRRPRLPIWGDKSGDNCGEPLSTFCAAEAERATTVANHCRLFARPKPQTNPPLCRMQPPNWSSFFPLDTTGRPCRWRHGVHMCRSHYALCQFAARRDAGGPLRPPWLSQEPSQPLCGKPGQNRDALQISVQRRNQRSACDAVNALHAISYVLQLSVQRHVQSSACE